ncbi:MAG: type II toxin-antitoxin system PemK/MazF family toxin [Gemmatimonadetes bacterium]|jgi:hypothetical protein|nr:type II toxin-antitoxin system PemK/MazF family toxin [Gemmatimonadota bacterium]MBT5804256.1 type II toxin-antitoxin system PemK/MazF family toxin [Gemmatimonadota bacterium]
MNRGDVWWVSFDPSVGGDARKRRPAVIVSNDASNKHLGSLWIPGSYSQGTLHEQFEQRFSSFSHVVNKFEETQI